MVDMIEQLIEVLEQSEEDYRQLLPIIQQEKEAALCSQVHKFTSVAIEKKILLAQLATQDRRRTALLHQISKHFNIPAPQLTISTLAVKVGEPQAARLKRLSASLGELVHKIRFISEENRQIIQHCLKLVQGALGFLHHWIGASAVYGASGRMDDNTGSGKLLSGTV